MEGLPQTESQWQSAVLRFCQNLLNHDNDCETAVKNVPRWLPPGTSTRWIEWLPMAL